MPSPEYDKLIYLDTKYKPRDTVDKGIEALISKLARVETEGTEEHIPKEGPLIIAFMPHSGFMEVPLIDKLILKRRREPVVWITKEETQDIRIPVQMERRFIWVDRKSPDPSTFKAAYNILRNPNGIIGSALEGTRFSNPNDPKDVLTLGKTKPGLMRFSYEASVPIMGAVVLGSDRILPSLDKTIKEKGMIEGISLVVKGFIKPKDVQIRFLPVYTDHLENGIQNISGEEKRGFIDMHNEIFTHQIIEEIIKLKPDYPLGYYDNTFNK